MSFSILSQSFVLEINDISKFPTLLKHLVCHYEDGDNLADFMDLHYGNNIKTHESKHNEHKDLPFKHQHSDNHFQLVYVVNFNNLEITSSEKSYESKNFHYIKTFSNTHINRLFQPPQK